MRFLRFADGSDELVEGLLVPYGGSFNGRDSYGTYASPRTNFCLDWFTERPFLYHHGLDSAIRAEAIGTITSLQTTDKGVWMQAQLKKAHDYYRECADLIDSGNLGLSSGAISHLVQIDDRTGEWLQWPIAEGSATPTPSNLLATIDVSTLRHDFRAAGIALPDGLVANTPAGPHPFDFRTFTWSPEAPPPRPDARQDDPKPGPRPAQPARASAGDAPIETERSFEDIREDINAQLWHNMVMADWGVYEEPCYVVATYPDYVIICYWEDGECSYWKIAYSLDATGDPVLGDKVEMEQVYVPVAARTSVAPLILDAMTLRRQAATFVVRTKDLNERRTSEGRALSRPNQAAMTRSAAEMRRVADSLEALVHDAATAAADAAEAAKLADPTRRAAMIALLDLGSFATVSGE